MGLRLRGAEKQMGNMDELQSILNDISKLRDKLADIPDYIIQKDQYRKVDNRLMNSYNDIEIIYNYLVLSKEQYLLDNPIKSFRFK